MDSFAPREAESTTPRHKLRPSQANPNIEQKIANVPQGPRMQTNPLPDEDEVLVMQMDDDGCGQVVDAVEPMPDDEF